MGGRPRDGDSLEERSGAKWAVEKTGQLTTLPNHAILWKGDVTVTGNVHGPNSKGGMLPAIVRSEEDATANHP
jgi:hypothetical protein